MVKKEIKCNKCDKRATVQYQLPYTKNLIIYTKDGFHLDDVTDYDQLDSNGFLASLCGEHAEEYERKVSGGFQWQKNKNQ